MWLAVTETEARPNSLAAKDATGVGARPSLRASPPAAITPASRASCIRREVDLASLQEATSPYMEARAMPMERASLGPTSPNTPLSPEDPNLTTSLKPVERDIKRIPE